MDRGRISGDAPGRTTSSLSAEPVKKPQTARALAGVIPARRNSGSASHPEKTRIVHVDHGFEFLGYKVKRGKGLRLSALQADQPCQSAQTSTPCRAKKSVARFKDQNPQPDAATSAGDAAGHDRGDKPDHPRAGGIITGKRMSEKLFHRLDGWIERRLWSFISKRWRNTAWRRYPSSCLIADFGLVRLIYLVPGIRPQPSPISATPHRKAACGKNCTSRLSERAEAGRKPHLSRPLQAGAPDEGPKRSPRRG